MLLLVLVSVERNDASATGPSVKPDAKVLSLRTNQKMKCLVPLAVENFIACFGCISLCLEPYWQLFTLISSNFFT